MAKLIPPKVLPAEGTTEIDIYNEIEQACPDSGFVDGTTITISGGKLQVDLSLPRWVKQGVAIAFDDTDLNKAAVSAQKTLFTLQGGGIIHAVKLKHSTAFAAPAITDLTASVGLAAAPSKYMAPFDILQAIGDTIFQINFPNEAETQNVSGVDVKLELVAIGANLDTLTAGVLDVWVLHSAAI